MLGTLTHALYTECDKKVYDQIRGIWISTHALYTECDPHLLYLMSPISDFNPRTLYRVRRQCAPYYNGKQSPVNPRTLSRVRHTLVLSPIVLACISTHALYTECDLRAQKWTKTKQSFQPTHSIQSAT